MTIEINGAEDIKWYPNKVQIEQANLTDFLREHRLRDYQHLVEKAAEEPSWFYPAFIDKQDIRWEQPYETLKDTSNGVPHTEWFKGGHLNLYRNSIEKHLEHYGTQPALIWEGEEGNQRHIQYNELDEEVNRLAIGLQQLGVTYGDRVGIYLPPIPEAAFILYACAKLGAIAVPMFSGYGADAVATRLNDSRCKILITADGSLRKGKTIPMKHTADQAVAQSPSVEHVIIVENKDIPYTKRERDIPYHEALREKGSITTRETKASDPFLIIYTSGTTGKPKGTIHTHSSFTIKTLIDMYFCFDVKREDTLFWMTDIGWIMGPWLIIGAHLLRATAVLYEGDVNYPDPGRLLELVEKHRLTFLGMAPTVVRTLKKNEERLPDHDLSSLKVLGSTGEPIDKDSWRWVIETIGGGDCPIINYSGGTEAGGGIIGCYPTMPLRPAAFHGPIPGMRPDIVDSNRQSLRNLTGELIVRRPFVGMTKSFWDDNERYLKTYWSRWPDIWVHGDLASIDLEGYWYIKGRADDTLKVAGKRIGPAEIEDILIANPKVKEAAVIGIPDDIKGQSVICFVTIKHLNDQAVNPVLRQRLLEEISQKLGKPLKPTDLFFVDDFPRTQSRKIVRRVIKRVYLNENPGDLSAIANPDILNDFTCGQLQNRGVV